VVPEEPETEEPEQEETEEERKREFEETIKALLQAIIDGFKKLFED